MPRHLSIDFETRSTVDLKKVGVYNYMAHPSTRVLCVAIATADRAGLFYDMDKLPQWALDALADETMDIHAWHATVERLCIKLICGPRHGWPVPRGRRYKCTAAKSRRLALPGKLEKIGPALDFADHFLKDMEGHKIMLRVSKPLPIRKGKEGTGHQFDDDPEKLKRLGEYCKRDVIAEEMAESRMLPMGDDDWEDYFFTERMNDRGVQLDVKLVKRLVYRAVEAARELDEQIADLTDGMVQTVGQVAQLKAWVEQETGITLTTLRKEDYGDLLGEANKYNLPKYVIRVLKLRQDGAKSSVSKLLTALNRVSADGRLRGEFVYHGASTGRYTSMGVQLQNLIRDCLKDFDGEIKDLDRFTLEQITLAIRGCFIPAKGHVFVDADYNAIEARGVAWLAGCKKLIKAFQDGVDTYCLMAEVIYGHKVTEETFPWERFVGKQTILGCGYGMGAQKFEDQCIKFGKPVGMDTAQLAVSAYREEYPEIPQLWRDMEDAATEAVQHPGRVTSIPNGLVSFRVAHKYLQMLLPSGRRLFYKDPKILRKKKFGRMQNVLTFMGVCPRTKRWLREETWGGTLTENAVQAIARDVLFAAMRELDRRAIDVVLSVHDQVIAEVLEEDGEWASKTVKRVMERVPPWAKGFPIKTKPKIAMRFGK